MLPRLADTVIVGIWQGYATIHETQQVPVTIRISHSGTGLGTTFLNGPAEHAGRET